MSVVLITLYKALFKASPISKLFATLITAMFLKQFKVTELKSENQFFHHAGETWFSMYASLQYRFSAFQPQTIFFVFD